MKVAVLGSGGFVGRALIQKTPNIEWIAIQRSQPSAEVLDFCEWRSCDLLDPVQAEISLAGVDVAVYLVHSMAPTGIELQGCFEDIDALIALNIAEAARRQGVRKLIYLGGLIPQKQKLSKHLESRLEVEKILQTSGCPLISLRAGLVIGAFGSSFELMSKLVQRLPVMLCPSWTNSMTEVVALEDVVCIIKECLQLNVTEHQIYDLGNEEPISYRNLMRVTAEALGVKRRFFSVALFAPGLSVLWVSLITNASRSLVRPLVQSLREDMLPRANFRYPRTNRPIGLQQALKNSISIRRSSPNTATPKPRVKVPLFGYQTRIVNRLPFIASMNEVDTGRTYFKWLGTFLPGIIRVKSVSADNFRIFLGPFTKAFLILCRQPEQERPGLALFEIEQGLLVRRRDSSASPPAQQSFAFRRSAEAQLSLGVIENYSPSLPRWTYSWTQAVAHQFVMFWFAKSLRKQKSQGTAVH